MGPLKNSNLPFFILMGLVTLLFLYLLKPFFFPLFWAAVIAGIFQPLYRRINRKLNYPSLSTILVHVAVRPDAGDGGGVAIGNGRGPDPATQAGTRAGVLEE